MAETMTKAQKSGFLKAKIRISLIVFHNGIRYGGFNAKTLFAFANDSQQDLISTSISSRCSRQSIFFHRKSQIRRKAKTESHGSHADSRVA